MPMIIHPRITGTVNIEMSHEEAKVLAGSLDVILSKDAQGFVGLTIRDTINGKTCNDFWKALQSVTT